MSKFSAIGGNTKAPNMQTPELVNGSLFLPSVLILYPLVTLENQR